MTSSGFIVYVPFSPIPTVISTHPNCGGVISKSVTVNSQVSKLQLSSRVTKDAIMLG